MEYNKETGVELTPNESSAGSLSQVRLETDAAYAHGGGNKFYEPIPEYEGIHRYDPKFEWEEEEEKKLIRRVIINDLCEVYWC